MTAKNFTGGKPMSPRLRTSTFCVFICLCLTTSLSHAMVATEKATVDLRRVTYTYTLGLVPEDGPFDEIQVSLTDITQIDLGTYVGAGVPALVSTPPPAGKGYLQITRAPGSPSSVTFSIMSIEFPKVAETKQTVSLLFGGRGIQSAPATLAASFLGTHLPGTFAWTVVPGSLSPGSAIALLQTTTDPDPSMSVFLGTGTAAQDGSASIGTSRALTTDEVFVGINGTVSGRTSISIPTLSQWGLIISALLMLTGLTIIILGRRHSPAEAGNGAGLAGETELTLPFVPAVFAKAVISVFLLVGPGLGVAVWLAIPIDANDVVGASISSVILGYLVHLWIVNRHNKVATGGPN